MSAYITFDGVVGSGKTTVMNRIAERIRALGLEVVIVSEPGGTEFGKTLRELVTKHGDLSPTTEALLYSAARRDLIERVVQPALDAGKIVLSERSAIATQAHQGVALAPETVLSLTAATLPEGMLYDLGVILHSNDVANVTQRGSKPQVGDADAQQTDYRVHAMHRVFYRHAVLVQVDQSIDEVVDRTWMFVEGLLREYRML